MKYSELADRRECTIVCTFTGNPTTRHLVVKERVFPSNLAEFLAEFTIVHMETCTTLLSATVQWI